MEWQPIEIMPGDWEEILLLCQDGMCVAFWDPDECEWVSDLRGKGNGQWVLGAKYWMPLPEPPSKQ